MSMLSTADDLGSKFYRSYPSREAGKLAGGMRLAYFDHLQLYCGLGFDRSNIEHRCRPKSHIAWQGQVPVCLAQQRPQETEVGELPRCSSRQS
jgi:hypothetical protein